MGQNRWVVPRVDGVAGNNDSGLQLHVERAPPESTWFVELLSRSP
jgi:hypothetical protein